MAHAQSVDWDDPESVPVFIEAFWPCLPDENKRRVHHQLRPFLPDTAELLSQGNIEPIIQTATSLPRIQSMSALPTPSHQRRSSREPAEAITTPQLTLEKSIHASKPTNSSRRTSRRLPCAPGPSDEPLVTTNQQICSQRSSRVAATTPAGPLPAVPPMLKMKESTKNLPDHPIDTLAELVQSFIEPLQSSPSVTRDISETSCQLPEPHSHPLFSGANDDTKKLVLKLAEAFFSNHGRNLQQCKNIVEKQYETKALVISATRALRFHCLALVCLRDHLVQGTKRMPLRKKLNPNQAKLKLIEAQRRLFPNMTESDVSKKITEELDAGTKYANIVQQFSISAVPRLNHKCTSRYEGHKLTKELVGDLEGEGAKPRKILEDLAGKGEVSVEVVLEIVAAGFFLWTYYQHHLTLFPQGCGGQNCHWGEAPTRLHHEHETGYPTGTRIGNITADPPSNINFEMVGNVSAASPMLSHDITELRKHNMALLLRALAPANETSFRSFLSLSSKRSDSSGTVAPAKRPKKASDVSNPRLRTWSSSGQAQSANHPPQRRHDAAQPPTDARYGPQLNEADTTGDAIHNPCPPPSSNVPSMPDLEPLRRWDDLDFLPPNELLIPDSEPLRRWDDLDFLPPNELLIPSSEPQGQWDDLDFLPPNELLIPDSEPLRRWDDLDFLPPNELLIPSSEPQGQWDDLNFLPPNELLIPGPEALGQRDASHFSTPNKTHMSYIFP
ncbi:hypothetical protein BBO_09509 [Beauveria brongniartii RCEF 3172]|uniref:Uncharacterized protein n=1 Tax=Beauveria brongniartii RCEF 3172 TaxID=1081107 RepID=A0A168EX58_9HYPO|nr:hypothetical protein BBO_09509 [Beauveria brongniartii RCEF 3172]